MATHKGPRARGPIRGSPLVTAFFVGLGLEVEGSTFVEGEFVDTVIGIPDSRTEIVMLRPHGGGTGIELSSFVRPRSRAPIARGDGNELGLRSVVFEVDDLQAAVDGLAAGGYGLVGGIGQHENIWRMAYVRGPEGIIVSLTERIDGRRVAARYPCVIPPGAHARSWR
jgi:catechol 2,3-dioxygenase-like lactoylglutathione lyase family enzyme